MVSLCFYFQVHQPYRLRNYSIFDIGDNHDYFDKKKNKEILKKVARKCYIPTNKVMLNLLKKFPDFKISYSFSGVVLDQLEEYSPEALASFKELVDTGQVEILGETYYHSLAFLYSKKEFSEQVRLHKEKIKKLFNYEPKIFRNTELIYNNELAGFIEGMGYKGVLAEGADHILGQKSPNFVYHPTASKNIKLLLKNYNKGWKEWPLTVPKFSKWVNANNGNGNCINLFMDYETFGEHQWEDTGIFNFLKHLPQEILKHPDNDFVTPSDIVKRYPSVGELDIHHPISWADVERDLSAWQGNRMQQASLKRLYDMEESIKMSNDQSLIEDWRKLQTSDHFYYMCTKWFNDGDVHKYFNPYDSPYDAFIVFTNAANDIMMRLKNMDNAIIAKKR